MTKHGKTPHAGKRAGGPQRQPVTYDISSSSNTDDDAEGEYQQLTPPRTPAVFVTPVKKASHPRGRGRPPKSSTAIQKVRNASGQSKRQEAEQARNSAAAQEALQLLCMTAAALSKVDVYDLLRLPELEHVGAADVLNAKQAISKVLRSQDDPKAARIRSAPSTAQHYDDTFVYRPPGNLIYVLRPVEVFRGIPRIFSRDRKTLGFVRTSGSAFPLMFALSGWTRCVEEHPLVLDQEFWSNEAFNFGGAYNFRFRRHMYDAHHNKEAGRHYASHVEPQLMLFYACHMLIKLGGFRADVGLNNQIGDLWKLGHHNKKKEAEIVVSREPCLDCHKFKKKIEDMTHIQFKFVVVPNVGDLMTVKDAAGYQHYLSHVAVEEGAEEEEDEDVDENMNDKVSEEEDNSFILVDQDVTIIPDPKQKMQVEIRSHPHDARPTIVPIQQQQQQQQQEEQEESHQQQVIADEVDEENKENEDDEQRDQAAIDAIIRSHPHIAFLRPSSKKKKIRSFTYATTMKTKRKHAFVESDDEDLDATFRPPKNHTYVTPLPKHKPTSSSHPHPHPHPHPHHPHPHHPQSSHPHHQHQHSNIISKSTTAKPSSSSSSSLYGTPKSTLPHASAQHHQQQQQHHPHPHSHQQTQRAGQKQKTATAGEAVEGEMSTQRR